MWECIHASELLRGSDSRSQSGLTSGLKIQITVFRFSIITVPPLLVKHMSKAIDSLIASGTKLYLDSIDPELVKQNIEWGAVGATSNPIIVAALVQTGRFDSAITKLLDEDKDDQTICWDVTDMLVRDAQAAFHDTWKKTGGNAGWVSFELDPLIEDPERNMPHNDRVEQYIVLGRKWAAGHDNRMIKVPATPAGLEAAETLAASGITLNITLIFSERQYLIARDNIWAGINQSKKFETFKSVYSIFVSRVDQYTAKHNPRLSQEAQGQYGILNAKRIWKINRDFWATQPTKLQQEMIFASTGTKDPKDVPWKYVGSLAGSDIQTNPPETNTLVANSTQTFDCQVDKLPSEAVQNELDAAINVPHLESVLMEEGIAKFAAPQHKLIETIAKKRAALANAS